MRLLGILVLAVLAGAQAHGQQRETDEFRYLLTNAKMTGACGVMDSLIQFQSQTQIEGGDAFVTRFYNMEAARLGLTVDELISQCDDSVSSYNALVQSLDSIDSEGP